MNIEFNEILKVFKKTKVPFAVTGSWAIKLHAEHIGLNPHRMPKDFDFSVTDFNTFIKALSSLGYKLNSFPGQRAKRVTLYKWPYEVDLLKAGSSLAPNLNNSVFYRNTPVASIRSLMRQKKNILETINNSKARRNLNFLIVLENFKTPVVVRRRIKNLPPL